MLKKIGFISIAIISMIMIVGCSDKNEKKNVEKSVVKKYTVKDMDKIGFKTTSIPVTMLGANDARKGTIDGINIEGFLIYESAEKLQSMKSLIQKEVGEGTILCIKENLLIIADDKSDCSILERL